MRALVIDQSAVKANLAAIRERAGAVELMADLSANGQGMGVVNAAKLLSEEGITNFAVTELRDAALLREAGFTEGKLLILRSVTDAEELKALLELSVVFTAGSYDAVIALNSIAEERKSIAEARIRINTGFGQYGFQPEETDKILNIFLRMPSIAVTGMYTGIAPLKNEKLSQEQAAKFKTCVEKIQEQDIDTGILMAHDTAALFRCELGDRASVCVGSAIIGRTALPDKLLTRVGCVEASIEEIEWAAKGIRAGLNSTKKLRKTAKTAIIDVGKYNGIGLSDGVEKSFVPDFGKKEPTIKVGGKKVSILGSVGYTATVIDVSDCECNAGSVAVIDADPRLIRGLTINIR